MKVRVAGLIYGPSMHYVDHLGPLCGLLQIPLFVTDEEIYKVLQTHYPQIEVKFYSSRDLPDELIQTIDIAIVCIPRAFFDEIFYFVQKIYNKKIHTIWCPHGNSDKGNISFFMEGLRKEKAAIVYGQKMIDFLKEKESFNNLDSYAIVGNFRKEFYLKNKQFYDSLITDHKFPKAEKIVFYAPTWEDREQSSSFEDAIAYLIEDLPPTWSLWIKLHPNLQSKFHIIEKYFHRERVSFLNDFPPIAPILNQIDIYIGDFSSIGYDLLSWNKPMFFLNSTGRSAKNDKGLFLYRCGVEICREKYPVLYQEIITALPYDELFASVRKEIDQLTFAPGADLLGQMEGCYRAFPDPDLNFF